MICVSCGRLPQQGERFCERCGAPVSGALVTLAILPAACAGAVAGVTGVGLAALVPIEDGGGFWTSILHVVLSTTLPYAPEGLAAVAGATAVATLPHARPASGLGTAVVATVLYAGGLALAGLVAGVSLDAARLGIAAVVCLTAGSLAVPVAALSANPSRHGGATRYLLSPLLALVVVGVALVVYGLIVTAVIIILSLLVLAVALWVVAFFMSAGEVAGSSGSTSPRPERRETYPSSSGWGGEEGTANTATHPTLPGRGGTGTHYDDSWEEQGHTTSMERSDGTVELTHYDSSWNKIGHSIRRRTSVGQWQTDHYDPSWNKTGSSLGHTTDSKRSEERHYDSAWTAEGRSHSEQGSDGRTDWTHYDESWRKKGHTDE